MRRPGADSFLAIVMSISALPIIAKTLIDMDLYRSDLGIVVISAAIFNDIVGWIIFAIILGLIGEVSGNITTVMLTIILTLAFIAAMLTAGRWLIHRILPFIKAYTRWPAGALSFALVLGLLCALAVLVEPVAVQATVHKDEDLAVREVFSDPAFDLWLDRVRQEAENRGISENTLDAAFRGVSPVIRVIELDRSQPEFTRTFWSYINRRITEERIEKGRELLEKHRDLLDEIGDEYGVPPRYIIAFWGLETGFGSHLGSFRVIDALATLAYDRRRPDFFRKQLFYALRIIEQSHREPDKMLGSWAGAMGHMQFLPSVFVEYAVDYTGSGRKDIWESLPDAFASAANYLSEKGWKQGQIWGREVILPEDFDFELSGLAHKKEIKQWSELGVRRADGTPLPDEDMEGSVILPQGHEGPAFLVYENFRVIMKWNRSVNYAVSVGHLADRLIDLPAIASGRKAGHEPLSRRQTEKMQRILNKVGFDAGPVDGIPGPRMRSAIRQFQKDAGLPADGYPSPDLFDHLRRAYEGEKKQR